MGGGISGIWSIRNAGLYEAIELIGFNFIPLYLCGTLSVNKKCSVKEILVFIHYEMGFDSMRVS